LLKLLSAVITGPFFLNQLATSGTNRDEHFLTGIHVPITKRIFTASKVDDLKEVFPQALEIASEGSRDRF
jgi:hypothetical protein